MNNLISYILLLLIIMVFVIGIFQTELKNSARCHYLEVSILFMNELHLDLQLVTAVSVCTCS